MHFHAGIPFLFFGVKARVYYLVPPCNYNVVITYKYYSSMMVTKLPLSNLVSNTNLCTGYFC